jgi:2-keto-4-pentenoate hydratase/2-oxohepta-3-ene-1,7-dioic acid hydratase in catechol pathway
MQFVRYSAGGPSCWGLLADGTVYSLADVPVGSPSLTAFTNESYRRYLGRLVAEGSLPPLSVADVQLHAPVPDPGKIVCIGLNYRDHAEEVKEDLPEEPLLFGKAPTAVTDPGTPIRIPPGIEEVDYEVELGIVIGRTAHRVEAASAGEYVAGYTVFNDVSGRDAQFADGQWFRGKGFDTFAPMGPALATGEEFDPNATDVRLRVNGETKQDSNTDQFIFDVPELVEYVSHAMTLEPGDVIPTGTPAGVGISREPAELLSAGDTVEAEIEGIGTLENPVVDGV